MPGSLLFISNNNYKVCLPINKPLIELYRSTWKRTLSKSHNSAEKLTKRSNLTRINKRVRMVGSWSRKKTFSSASASVIFPVSIGTTVIALFRAT